MPDDTLTVSADQVRNGKVSGWLHDRPLIIRSASGPRDDTKQSKTARDGAKTNPLRAKGKRWKPLQVANSETIC